jgi:hypothetical protein
VAVKVAKAERAAKAVKAGMPVLAASLAGAWA